MAPGTARSSRPMTNTHSRSAVRAPSRYACRASSIWLNRFVAHSMAAVTARSIRLKAIADAGRSPAQGVFGRRSPCWRPPSAHAAGAGAGQFRPSGRRLSEFTGAVGRSGGLCAGLRARPPLPLLELHLPDRCHERRDLLAEEQRPGARPGQLLRLRRARRRRGRTAQSLRSRPRSTGPAAITTASPSRAMTATRPARRPAPLTPNAGPGPTRGPDTSARKRAVS